MNQIQLQKAVRYCISQVDKAIETLGNDYPAPVSENSVYPSLSPYISWTSGFFSGMIWLAYEFTGEERYKQKALSQVDDYYKRIVERLDVDHHDMGFLYSPSCVAAYKLTGDEKAKEAALLAADNLCLRFQEKGQFLQAWGEMGAKDNYRLIIDCLLNLPLLFWANEMTGEERYRQVALSHLHTAVKCVIRPDGSTYHTYFFNPETGAPAYGETAQGYSANSIWARGQAWGIYGLALAYKQTRKQELKGKFIQVTNVFLENLPSDDVPAWDMIFTDTDTLKDSSAATIAVCGILEMSRHCKLPEHFLKKAQDMMKALQKDYLTEDIPESNGILKHAVYTMPGNSGVDECNIWGDYYYMEALMRLQNPDWNSYWD